MDEYMLVVTLASFVIGVISLLVHPRLSPISSGALGILLLFSFLSPIEALVGEIIDMPTITPSVPPVSENYESFAEEAYRDAMTDYILEVTGLKDEDVIIEPSEFSFTDMRYARISVTLVRGGVFFDKSRLYNLIYENFVLPSGSLTIDYSLGGEDG